MELKRLLNEHKTRFEGSHGLMTNTYEKDIEKYTDHKLNWKIEKNISKFQHEVSVNGNTIF